MIKNVLYDNDISPIPPFSPFFFDTNEQDIDFFQDHPHFLPQEHHLLTRDTSIETIAESEVDNNMELLNNIKEVGDHNSSGDKNGSNKTNSTSAKKNPKKRPFTKDRHSKIVTAQGPRDRRMRLSLDIARRFFMVQDMLGVDKASKTVEWLLVQSKEAIKELSAGVSQSKLSCTESGKSVSSSSECEVLSGYDEMATDEYLQQVSNSGGNPSSGIYKEKRTRKTRKVALSLLDKESRTKARARARERTIGKMWSRSQQCPEVKSNGEERLPNSQSQGLNSTVEAVTEVEPPSCPSLDCQPSVKDIADESFAKSTSSPIFDYHHDMDISQGLASHNFSNLSGAWDLDSSGTSSSHWSMMHTNFSSGNLCEQIPNSFSQTTADTTLQPQVADMQFYMTWESYRR